MASDAINPAVPGPSDPSDANAPRRPAEGLIASLLAPVAPARPTFDLTAPAGAEGATDTAVNGASSAAYHGTEEATQQDSKTAAAAAQKKGIWRAWMLAGAARWGRGGGTQNKRLDMKKAKAQAQQVKETRTVSINRSTSPIGKTSSGNSGGSKSLGSKGNSGGAVKGPKNSNGKAHQGSAGRSGGSAGSGSGGSGGRGPSGGRSANGPAGRGGSASPKDSKTNGGGRAPKPEKTSLTKGSTTNSPKGSASGGSASGKSGAPGPAGSAGKSGGAGSSGSAGGSKGSGSVSTTDGKNGKALAPKGSASGKDTKGTKQSAGQDGKQTTSKDTNDTKPTPKSATDPAKTNDKTKVNLRKLNPLKGKTDPQTTADQKTTQSNGKPFSVRDSRETGYRDGTRAAKVAAHTKAYRDGVKDGWTDVTQAAEQQKARLDQAHEARKQARDEEKPVTGTQTSADYHQPEPIGVKEVTATHVVLGDGAAKDSVTRGEVRTLKSFERRLGAKSDSMTKVAEMTKGMQAHAEEQAKKAMKLLEDAKAVKGGEKLAGTLARMEEAARIQADKAKEIHKRAVRAAEACAVVLTNVETRYGGMYKAVVDSDETAPAELHFYKDQG